MSQFPSKLEFFSFLKYSPDGKSEVSLESRKVRDAIKNDGFDWGCRVIDHAARRLKEETEKFRCLSSCFHDGITLIPVPRSSPLKEHSIWPSRRICQAMVESNVAQSFVPALIRERSVNVSHFSGIGEHPEPIDHYSSTSFAPILLGENRHIVLVDDVVTRGSTFLGMVRRLLEHLPDAKIRCFAFLRPIRGEIDRVLEPIRGEITYRAGILKREP